MAKISCYASGNGALGFVMSDSHGRALPERVTQYQATRYMVERGEPFEGYRLAERHGEALLIPDISRLNACMYLFNGREYLHRGGLFYVYCEHERVKEWVQVKHTSTLAALQFFIENESSFYAGS